MTDSILSIIWIQGEYPFLISLVERIFFFTKWKCVSAILTTKDAIQFYQQNCAQLSWWTELEVISNFFAVQSISAVQPCRHSPHVTTVHLNVATGRFSRNGFIVKILTKLLFNSIFLHIVVTAKTLSPQKWRMGRQGSFWLDNAALYGRGLKLKVARRLHQKNCFEI